MQAKLDGKDHRRWRFRISTLMLLVALAALASYVVVRSWHAAQEARLAVERERAVADAERERERLPPRHRPGR